MRVQVKGKYALGERLGGGGMAEVFAGVTLGHQGFTRAVAIKRILPGYSSNPDFAKMFVSEAKLSASLTHPNIVATLDFDRDDDDALFLVMELVSGVDLDALSKSGPLPISVVIYLISEVLRGLGFAHNVHVGDGNRGVLHRDISPHNVLLSWEGAVKISDFGLAKARAVGNASASELLKGKPAYMSPEQANSQVLDGRSDLFAVGIVFWELLTGRRLFAADDTRATFAALFFSKIPKPSTVRADIPKDVERVVMKLLERQLSDRYPTAEMALVDLLACETSTNARDALIALLFERFQSIGPSQGYRFAASANIAKKAETSFPTLNKARLHSRRAIVVACFVAIAGAGVAAFVATRPAPTALDVASVVLPPGCITFIGMMERLSRCKSQSPEYRKTFAAEVVSARKRLASQLADGELLNQGCLASSEYLEKQLRACSDTSAPPAQAGSSAAPGVPMPLADAYPVCTKLMATLERRIGCGATVDTDRSMYQQELDGLRRGFGLINGLEGEKARMNMENGCETLLFDVERASKDGC